MAQPQLYRRVTQCESVYYVWDGLVRVSHWINVAAVAVLIATGLYIGGTFFRPATDEPSRAHIMATVMNVHFLAAVVFTLNGLVRAYWFFAGHTYRQWFRFHIWKLDYWKEALWKVKDYLTLRYEDYEPHTLGHNTLASLTYVAVFVVASWMGLTGFAMRGAHNPGGFLNTLFGWVIPALGGIDTVRMLHRFGMWLIIAFMIHHITFVFYVEVLREKGLVSSMIDGVKMRPPDWKPIEKPWKSPRS
jgi:Ni/Fe-hydrogenase 1 B-type cytochrome subunit